jgi:hypothetical protein
MRKRLLLLAAAMLAIAAIAYLHDPEWLINVESGFRGWETATDGTRYRWTNGHASFFVLSDASTAEIPVRTTVSTASDVPVLVTLTIDDRLADQLVLNDDGWQRVKLRLPVPGSRRVRRIDIRVNRTKTGNRGVQVGEVMVR